MPLIKKYHNERDFIEHQVDSITDFMLDNIADLKAGYRIYDKCAAVANDITENADALLSCEDMVMLRPAKGGLIDAVGGLIDVILDPLIKLFTPDIPTATQAGYDSQTSATNALGQRTNEAAIGSRMDDIWGKVARHIPRLIQVPHQRFSNNIEEEHFALHISMGKVAIENVRDGDTAFNLLPNGKFNAWWPGGNPNNAVAPDYNIGGLISRELVNVSKSSELQSAELLPPNDLSIGGEPVWLFTSDGTTGTITLSNYVDLDVDLREVFSVGEDATLQDCRVRGATSTSTYWRDDTPNPAISRNFTTFPDLDNADGTYEILTVNESNFTLDVTGFGWGTYTDRPLLGTYYPLLTTGGFLAYTEDSVILDYSWYTDEPLTTLITIDQVLSLTPDIAQAFTSSIGPIKVADNCDTVSFNFVADSGFFKVVNGTDKSVSVNINILFQETDENGTPTGTTFDTDILFESNSGSIRRQAAITYDRANPFQYGNVFVRRTTDRDKGSGVSNNDSVYWRDLFFYTDIGAQDYGNVTIAQCVIPSSIVARSVKDREVNMDVTRYITPYIGDGNFGPEAPVSTWAETLIATALDSQNGRLTIDEIDADLLLDVQQQLIDYYGFSDYVQVGYDLDDTSLRYQDIYALFCNAVNVRAYSQGATYKAYPDIDRTESSKQFTHRNKIQGTDTKQRIYDTDNDGVEVTYRSNETGNSETIIRHVNGIDSNNRLSINLAGAVNEKQATIRANRELNILKYQKYSFSFEADGIARLTVPGERVDNVDNTRIVKRENNLNTYNVYDGYVVAQNGLEIELSQPVEFETGETHTIRLTSATGDLLEAIECTAGTNKYFVNLAQAPSQEIYTGFKRDKTTFTFASDASRLQLPVIVRELKAKSSGGLKTRTLSAINYNQLYYQSDKEFSEV